MFVNLKLSKLKHFLSAPSALPVEKVVVLVVLFLNGSDVNSSGTDDLNGNVAIGVVDSENTTLSHYLYTSRTNPTKAWCRFPVRPPPPATETTDPKEKPTKASPYTKIPSAHNISDV